MLRLLLVGLCCAVGVGAAFKSRFGALLFYVWFAVFRPQDYLWFSIVEYRPSLLIGLFLVVSSAAYGVLPIVFHPLWIGSVAFWLLGLIAQGNAVAPDIGWTWVSTLGTMIIVSGLAIHLTNSRTRFKALIGVIAASFAFFSAKAGIASVLGGGLRYWDGLATGAFSDNNGYAVGCVIVIPFVVAMAQCARTRLVRLAWSTACVFTIVTIVSTYSRGGFLALAFAALVWLGLQRNPVRKLVAATAVALVTLVAIPLPEGYTDRLRTIQTYEDVEETSALSRLHVWAVAIQISKDNPLGIGLWNFQSIYDRYDPSDGQYGRRRAVHNSHLQALVETGWAGGLLWEALMLGGIWYSWRVRSRAATLGEHGPFFRSMANALIVSQAGFLVGGTFISLAYNDLTWLSLGCVAALDRLAAMELASLPGNATESRQVSGLGYPIATTSLRPAAHATLR